MFLRKKSLLVIALILSLAVALVGCGGKTEEKNEAANPPQEEVKGNITAVGSTALQPLVEQASSEFMAKNSGIQVVVQGGGSGTGLTQVSQGAADIGNSDIFAEEKDGIDASKIKDNKVAVVGMAAVVNPEITIDNLTKDQLKDIFAGKITNWKEVGGPDQKITLVNRPKGSGTRATFKKFALDGIEEAQGIEEDSSGTVRKIVKETPGAISYLALSYLDGSVKAIKLDSVEATQENICEGKYPVWAYEHMYTQAQPSAATTKFIEYMLSDDVQKTIVTKLGYIPVTEMKVTREAK